MFGRKKKGTKEKTLGLSAGLRVVDRLMHTGLDSVTADHNYGQAYAELRSLYIQGTIDKEELEASIDTLKNQHLKIRSRALQEESMRPLQ